MPHWPIYTGMVKSINNYNVFTVLHALNNPQNSLRNIIHIGGTNGKGSTTAYCKSILKEHGFKVATYTSPHLINCNERFDLNGDLISDDQLYYYIEKTRLTCEKLNIDITMFEATTIACILCFADFKADFNIIEVGMGGLNDATNVFTPQNLSCCILTSISLDHSKFLGPTTYHITLQKLGILKQNIPSIISLQNDPLVYEAIHDFCSKAHIQPIMFGIDYDIFEIEDSQYSNYFILNFADKHIAYPKPSMLGQHQIINAAHSLIALHSLKTDISNFTLNHSATCTGIKNAFIAGRMQPIHNPKIQAIIGQGEVFFDGAHNQGGATTIADFLSSYDHTDIFTAIIVGRSKDTDSAAFFEPLKNLCDIYCAVTVHGEIKPEHHLTIKSQAESIGIECHSFNNIEQAISCIATFSQNSSKKSTRLIICGSLYLARDIENFGDFRQ